MKDYTQTSENNQGSGVLSDPLSFLRNGFFRWISASPEYRGGDIGDGDYWSLRSDSTVNSNYLIIGSTYLRPQYKSQRGYGFAVRYVVNPSPLSLILAIL